MIAKYSLNGYNRKDTFSRTVKDNNKPNLVKKKKKLLQSWSSETGT